MVDDSADIISDHALFNRFVAQNGANHGNILIYVGDWFDGFYELYSIRTIRRLCGDTGSGGSIVCVIPTLTVEPSPQEILGIGFQLDGIPLANGSDHFDGSVHLMFDKSDVYPDPVSPLSEEQPLPSNSLSDETVKLYSLHGLASAIGHLPHFDGEFTDNYGTAHILSTHQ